MMKTQQKQQSTVSSTAANSSSPSKASTTNLAFKSPSQKSLIKRQEDDSDDENFEQALSKQMFATSVKSDDPKESISGKEFYKAMQKVKDRGMNAVPPKKSASAYIIFGKEKRQEILQRNPVAKVTEVVKEIAQCWKKLTKQDKIKYKEAAKRDRERYERELKSLESYSEKVVKPKKCLSAYMIFVKETRPKIVEQHSEMNALQVMQEVGKQWQALTDEERQYFQDKADRDKVRYLKEQKAFYDEVEKIGSEIGTVTNPHGQIVVASNFYSQNGADKSQKFKQSVSGDSQSQILQKRKFPQGPGSNNESFNGVNKNVNSTPQKRLKGATFEETKNDSIKIQMPAGANSLQTAENKPKKPLSAYIYFSQEFREIIRQRFPFLTVAQIMKAVSYRWQNLTKEQKLPFEQIAVEDKQRYDKDVCEYKKGIFQGRSQTPSIKLQSEQISTALEISDSLLQFLQVKVNNNNENQNEDDEGDLDQDPQEFDDNLNEDGQEEEFDDDNLNKEVDSIYQSNKFQNNHGSFKVVIENMEEAQFRNRKDSFLNPITTQNLKIDHEEQAPEIFKDSTLIQVQPGHILQDYQQPPQQYQFVHQAQASQAFLDAAKLSLGANNQPFFAQSAPFTFGDQSMNMYLQNEIMKKEYERKMSMGMGFGFYPQNPMIASPMMQFQLGPNGLVIDEQTAYLNAGVPFQLPPSNVQIDNQQQQMQPPNPQNFLMPQSNPIQQQSMHMRQQSSPQLGPSNSNAFMNPYSLSTSGISGHQNTSQQHQGGQDFQQTPSFSPFLGAQSAPHQLIFQPFQQFSANPSLQQQQNNNANQQQPQINQQTLFR